MRKVSRRTDFLIVIVLLAICVYALISSLPPEKPSGGGSGQIVTPESYNGKKLGTMAGSQYESVTASRFPDSPIAYYSGVPDLYAALLAEKIEGFVMSEVTLRQMQREFLNVAWFSEALNTRNRYFGFAKTEEGEKLRVQMDVMLAEYKADGTISRIENIWYGDDETLKVVDTSGLTGENGTLSIGVSSTDEPYNYIKNNRLTGLNIDLVTRFAARYGYAIEYTDTEPSSLLLGLTTGKFDMLATSISYTEERAETILFSDPVFEFNTMLAVREEALAVPDKEPEEQAPLIDKIAESFEKTFIREDRWQLFLRGIGITCLITFAAAVLGTALAFGICMFRRTESRLANIISNIYVKIIQGIPMVVLLLTLYYVVFNKSELSAVWVAVAGFTLHFSAYCSETLRSGISSVPSGQREAALALGHTESQAFIHFILPQAVRNILPVYRGDIISLLKGTAVAGYISVQDLTKMSDIIRSRTYEAFFPLIATALIYFFLAWIIGLLLNAALKRLNFRPKGGKRS